MQAGRDRAYLALAEVLAAALEAIDTRDAMTSDRSYRKGLSFEAAKTEILSLAGTQFGPQAVQAFNAEEKTLRERVAMKCGMVSADIFVSQTKGG